MAEIWTWISKVGSLGFVVGAVAGALYSLIQSRINRKELQRIEEELIQKVRDLSQQLSEKEREIERLQKSIQLGMGGLKKR